MSFRRLLPALFSALVLALGLVPAAVAHAASPASHSVRQAADDGSGDTGDPSSDDPSGDDPGTDDTTATDDTADNTDDEIQAPDGEDVYGGYDSSDYGDDATVVSAHKQSAAHKRAPAKKRAAKHRAAKRHLAAKKRTARRRAALRHRH